jgi:UDP-2-acetamido-2-deoxy-ribo-hexuluronate aminotransferase
MDLLLDVNIVLDICQPRPAFVQPALQALSRGRREGDRWWLYAGSVQTLEYNLVKGLLDEARLQSQTLPRPEAHRRARQLLKTFAADKHWLAALAGEGEVFDSEDPEDEQLIRALARLGPDARLLSRDGPLAERYPDRVLSPAVYLAMDRPLRALEFIDLKTPQDAIRPALERNLHRVLHHGRYILGPEIAELEAALGEYVGVKHGLTVASGTDSLEIALRALGIGPGAEVITVPFTWISSAEVIGLVGATPVFVDIEPESFNIDVARIEAAITPRTQAILPVSLFGQMADFDAINALAARHGLAVIEDAAQSFGATQHGRRSGGVTTIGSTSFFPAKPLGCYGDGGALFTDDDGLAEKMRAIRTHGGIQRHHHPLLGMNGASTRCKRRCCWPSCLTLPGKWQPAAGSAPATPSNFRTSAARRRCGPAIPMCMRNTRFGWRSGSGWRTRSRPRAFPRRCIIRSVCTSNRCSRGWATGGGIFRRPSGRRAKC